jgi:outer membrane lipoprotein SlyB
MRVVVILVLSVLITGCTGSRPFVDEPIIDRKGVDMSRYYADKAECEAYADEVRTGKKVARGAVGGAVVGGAIGAIVDREPNSAERGAGVGAVTGGLRGAQEGITE